MVASMEAKSPNVVDEGNFMMSESQFSMPTDMMSNTQEQDPQSQELVNILRKLIQESVKKTRAMYRAQIAENVFVSPITEQQESGKRLKTTRLKTEQTVSFFLQEECSPASFKDREMLLPKLRNWRIQIRQRDATNCDTYFYHSNSSRQFRSIIEVLNYILPKNYMKVQKRQRSKGQGVKKFKKLKEVPNMEKSKGERVKKSKKLKKEGVSPSQNSRQTKEMKENIESSNTSNEILQSQLTEVHASSEDEPETLVEALIEKESIVDVESTHIVVTVESPKSEKMPSSPCKTSQDAEEKKENVDWGNSSKEILQPEVHASSKYEHETEVSKENLESSNSSKKMLQGQPEVHASSGHENEIHVAAIQENGRDDVEFAYPDFPMEPQRHPELDFPMEFQRYPDLEDISLDFSVNDYLLDSYFDL